MNENLTLQTLAAFERIEDALLGKTEDDFKLTIKKIDQLVDKYIEIEHVIRNMDSP